MNFFKILKHCPTICEDGPEPNLEHIIEHYYLSHGCTAAESSLFAKQYINQTYADLYLK